MGSIKGITNQNSSDRRSVTFPWGFRCLTQELNAEIRFIRVTNFRGIPLSNCLVTVNNPGDPLTTTTDNQGLTEILPNVSQNLTVDLKQYSTELKGVPYNTDTDPLIKTIILDTKIPQL